METRICKTCGKSLYGIDHYARRIFCSKSCWYKFVENPRVPRKCAREGCENIIPPEKDRRQKFCSHRCSALISNLPRHHPRFCPCGNKLKDYQKIYCSRKCWREHHSGDKYKRTEYKIKNNINIRQETARAFYIHERGHQCEQCKLIKWLGEPIFLSLHHEDGDFRNNAPENVKLLCGNCHPLTDTFGTKNWGNGRKTRTNKEKVYKASKTDA